MLQAARELSRQGILEHLMQLPMGSEEPEGVSHIECAPHSCMPQRGASRCADTLQFLI